MKILVADNENRLPTAIAHLFKQPGHESPLHEIITAQTGQEALELVLTRHPDLIILDVQLMGINGFECAKRIRAQHIDEWVPIMFLSDGIEDDYRAKGMAAGGDDYLTRPYTDLHLAIKIQLMQRMTDMRKKMTDAIKQVNTISAIDTLTGLYNRAQFEKRLKEEIAQIKEHPTFMAVMVLGLDYFKTINDSLGHEAGDLLLKETADRLQSSLRMDDLIAKTNGDEFAIFFNDIDKLDNVQHVALKLMNKIQEPYKLNANRLQISCSIGIACHPAPDIKNDNDLLNNAEIALRHAKEMGRNNFQVFTNELYMAHMQKEQLESALKFALERKEFSLTYQPIFDLKTKKLTRIEALLRWNHPHLGAIMPSVFFPLAEKLGLIHTIGRWALRMIGEQAKKWHLSNSQGVKILTKVSSQQLLTSNLPLMIADILKETAFDMSVLEFEFAETSSSVYSELSENILRAIHKMGIGICLNHFGMGSSSLIQLRRLPIDAIKIDEFFIHDLLPDDNNQPIVASVIALGKHLGFEVIAEGIQTKKEMEFLIEKGCAQGQGSYLSPPLNAESIAALLHKERLSLSV